MTNAKARYQNSDPTTKRKIRGVVLDLHEKNREKTASDILGMLGKDERAKSLPKPSIRAIQYMIQDREHPGTEVMSQFWKRFEELDKVWTLGSLDKWPLSPEGIAIVLKYHARSPAHDITVRRARWIDRLRLFAAGEQIDDKGELFTLSWFYELFERFSELAQQKTPVDTFALDDVLVAQFGKETGYHLHAPQDDERIRQMMAIIGPIVEKNLSEEQGGES